MWGFECVAYESDHYCVGCLPTNVTVEDEFIHPITALAEVDCWPVCCVCHREHDYMGLTADGQRWHSRRGWTDNVRATVGPAGTVPTFTSIGSYPLVYTDGDAVFCADCANDTDKTLALNNVAVHWEGAPLSCDECGDEIESAYGDPGVDDDDTATE